MSRHHAYFNAASTAAETAFSLKQQQNGDLTQISSREYPIDMKFWPYISEDFWKG
jgi:hypothetical protein